MRVEPPAIFCARNGSTATPAAESIVSSWPLEPSPRRRSEDRAHPWKVQCNDRSERRRIREVFERRPHISPLHAAAAFAEAARHERRDRDDQQTHRDDQPTSIRVPPPSGDPLGHGNVQKGARTVTLAIGRYHELANECAPHSTSEPTLNEEGQNERNECGEPDAGVERPRVPRERKSPTAAYAAKRPNLARRVHDDERIRVQHAQICGPGSPDESEPAQRHRAIC